MHSIHNIDIDFGTGEITDLDWETGGDGYTSDSVDVIIVSLFDGSGAVIRINVDEGSAGEVFTGFSAMKIHNPGSGYPTFSNANQVGSASPSLATDVYDLKSGEIRVINGDYGTGILRDIEIQ